jgi:hypothetical protein
MSYHGTVPNQKITLKLDLFSLEKFENLKLKINICLPLRYCLIARETQWKKIVLAVWQLFSIGPSRSQLRQVLQNDNINIVATL